MGKALLVVKSPRSTERWKRMTMAQEHIDLSVRLQRGDGGEIT